MDQHWLIAGVARSGTTAIYDAIQQMNRQRKQTFGYFYEPYLWGPPTWVPNFREVGPAFTSTNSIYPYGLRCHLATPLFTGQLAAQSAYHEGFINNMFKPGAAVLAKIIRGCGRLRDYLELKPDLKIIFIIRNPLDCLNSIVDNFSFFGDEFHPSDMPRFRKELEALGRPQPMFGVEVEAALAWWREMNEAALEVLRAHPERTFVAAYEAYTLDRPAAIKALGEFLAPNSRPSTNASLEQPVGRITPRIGLKADDVERIMPFLTSYFETLESISGLPIGDARALAERVAAKYQGAEPGWFAPDIARDASPLRVRALLKQEREARGVAAARVRQLVVDVGALEAKLGAPAEGLTSGVA